MTNDRTSPAPAISDGDSLLDDRALALAIKARARQLGFDLVGIAPAVSPATGREFADWLDAGYAGEMGYLERRRDAYEHPDSMLRDVRSLVMLGVNYYGGEEAALPPGAGRVARYARIPADYHDVLRDRLKQLADVLHGARPGCRTRGVVDTAPLLERDFARRAGLGWFGKNTMLLNKRLGSWFFLAALLTDVELPADEPHHTAHCGTCTRCLDACPTDAFTGPYVLDARKCISYLTIELGAKPIEPVLLPGMQDWAFGCDVCQDVCPWNSKAPISPDPAFRAAEELRGVSLDELLAMGEPGFQERYGPTPLARTGYVALLRNACLAAAETGNGTTLDALERAQRHESALVCEAAAWSRRAILERLSRGETASAGCDGRVDLAGRADVVQSE